MNNKLQRTNLGFQEEVKEYFGFLLTEYGFECVFSDPYCVKFNSDKVYLNVYHERISYEIYFEIGMLPEHYQNTLKVGVKNIIEATENISAKSFYQASTKENVSIAVKELANLVKQYGKNALIGTVEYFQTISDRKAKKQQSELIMEKLKIAENKAENAWKKKDYKTVIEIYENIEAHLNTIQTKKLELARKKLSGD